jgi:hypothetical protein
MNLFDDPTIKHGFAGRAVPLTEMVKVVPMSGAPQIGDMVLAEVLSVGKNKTLEVRSGVSMYLFEGDLIVGAFGHRYATDQYEGYVPEEPVEKCDLLSVGGVCGRVVSRHSAMGEPTKLRVLGVVGNRDGWSINQRDYGVTPKANGGGGDSGGWLLNEFRKVHDRGDPDPGAQPGRIQGGRGQGDGHRGREGWPVLRELRCQAGAGLHLGRVPFDVHDRAG